MNIWDLIERPMCTPSSDYFGNWTRTKIIQNFSPNEKFSKNLILKRHFDVEWKSEFEWIYANLC